MKPMGHGCWICEVLTHMYIHAHKHVQIVVKKYTVNTSFLGVIMQISKTRINISCSKPISTVSSGILPLHTVFIHHGNTVTGICR